jgi:hypothetical protein
MALGNAIEARTLMRSSKLNGDLRNFSIISATTGGRAAELEPKSDLKWT